LGVVLPNELVWVLNAIGVTWPNIDEDELRKAGQEFRQISSDLKQHKSGAMTEIEQMLHANSGESLKVFEALWNKVIKEHMGQLEEGLDVLAGAMDVCAGIVEAMKVAAIAELAAFAAETAADAAAAVATFGIAAAGEIVLEQLTERIVNGIIQQAVDQIEFQIKQALMAPVIESLGEVGMNLAEQLLGNALGVNQGVDLGALESAAKSGFSNAASASGSQLAGMVTNPLGQDGLGILPPSPGGSKEATRVGQILNGGRA
jgi:hypothetical protein